MDRLPFPGGQTSHPRRSRLRASGWPPILWIGAWSRCRGCSRAPPAF